MAERTQARAWQIARRIALEFLLPAAAFAVGVGLGTGDLVASVVTGLALSGAIYLLYWLHGKFLRPRLQQVPRDWLRLGLEMTASLLEHLAGALAALAPASVLSRDVRMETGPSAGCQRGVATIDQSAHFSGHARGGARARGSHRPRSLHGPRHRRQAEGQTPRCLNGAGGKKEEEMRPIVAEGARADSRYDFLC